MLHPLVPGGEKITVHAWRVAALLDQFDLHIARIRQRDRHVNVVVALAHIGERGHRQPVRIEPRPDPADLRPVLHRRFDIAHHHADLAHIPE